VHQDQADERGRDEDLDDREELNHSAKQGSSA
jgi:hypothetical protein